MRAALSAAASVNENTRLCSIWAGQHMVRNEFHSRLFSPPGDLNVKKIENPYEGTRNLAPRKQEAALGSTTFTLFPYQIMSHPLLQTAFL